MIFKLKKHSLVIWFYIIPCFVPTVLLTEGSYSKIFFNAWRVVAFCCVLFYLKKEKIKIRKVQPLPWAILFWMSILFSTISNGGLINSAVSIGMMIFTLISVSAIEIKKDIKLYLHELNTISYIILAVDNFQVFTGIGFDQINNGTWLGGDNFAIFAVLPMIGIIIMNAYINKGKITTSDYIIILLSFISKLKTFAVTSILAFAVLFVLSFIFIKVKNDKNFKITCFIFFLIVSIIVLYDFTGIYMGLSELIGKGSYIGHSRLAIWQASIRAITLKPLFGYGILDVITETVIIIGEAWNTAFSHTHNYILEILLQSGIIGTVFHLMMFKDFFRIILKDFNCNELNWFKAVVVSILVLWITDSYYTMGPIYVVIVLCHYLCKMKEQLSEDRYYKTTKNSNLKF